MLLENRVCVGQGLVFGLLQLSSLSHAALLLQERMQHGRNCTETAPKQLPNRGSLHDFLLFAGRGLMGIGVPGMLVPKVPPEPHLSQTQAVLYLPPALFAEGIKDPLGKPPLDSDNCLCSQL